MSSPSNNSSLRPGWFKGSGSGGGKGFQPPPTAPDRGEKARSSSFGSAGDNRRDSNKFAALLDDDDIVVGDGVELSSSAPSSKPIPSSNSRSEAFRSSFNRSSSTGNKGPGRSLADLAARVPEGTAPPGVRRHSAFTEGTKSTGRFAGTRSSDVGTAVGAIDSYKPDPKVVRYTREKLLSLRPPVRGDDPGPPAEFKPLEGSVIISPTAQDPVCWDTLDAEAIWEPVRERRASALTSKVALEGDARRRNAPPGRWSRGMALPPPEEAARRKEREADNPNELWDDPMGGVTGAASDFSAFGALPPDDGDGAFDFDKMAKASKKLEEEIHGKKLDENLSAEQQVTKAVDTSRPLASAGTILLSKSGDDVNVFEDFDAPSEPVATETEENSGEAPAVRGGDEDPSASSRLMKMIGVSREGSDSAPVQEANSNPWGANPDSSSGAKNADPIIGGIGGGSIPLNPWGDPIVPTGGSQPSRGMGIGLGAFGPDSKNREAVEREKIAQREAEVLRRRQQEEEVQRRALAEQKARQQQQTRPQQSEIELVLMERICVILENSWGRSDLASILSTLHSEDSRVIPLLGNVDSLRALIARSPQRVALRKDPSFGEELAVIQMTNSQWQQQQQQQQQERRQQQERIQQEELRRRRQMEEEANRAQAESRLAASINFNAPWFYSDPQNNIQGPFRGEEMRQWLEAGYFKGDLPISQNSGGPFHRLSIWFPDLHYAFRQRPTNGNDSNQVAEERAKAEAAENERLRLEAEAVEAKRRAAEEERRAAEEVAQRKAREIEAAARETERQKNEQALKAKRSNQNDIANESSNQLKVMLGLQAGQAANGGGATQNETIPTSETGRISEKKGKATNKMPAQKVADEPQAPAPAAPAWGGAASSKQTRKSMSEIQQEEARAAAMLAAKRGSAPQPSSGWANVAAGRPTAGVQNAGAVTGVRPSQARTKQSTAAPQAGSNRKVAPISQQQRGNLAASSTPAEEFGTSMSPSLEKWCKEKMVQINGSDDLTLVAFCMTLNDANEIRQYLTTYLGSTSQVNSFATEFINKRGLGNKQEEWETPGSAKKGRKKKAGR